jgi:hypothetical protein
MEVLRQTFPEGIEKNHDKLQVRISDVTVETGTQHPPPNIPTTFFPILSDILPLDVTITITAVYSANSGNSGAKCFL